MIQDRKFLILSLALFAIAASCSDGGSDTESSSAATSNVEIADNRPDADDSGGSLDDLMMGEDQAGELEIAFAEKFQQDCAVCHGENLEGAAQGTPLIGVDLVNGETRENLIESIAVGNPDKGMPAWAGVLSTQEIENLALFIIEKRAGFSYDTFNFDTPFEVPTGVMESEHHTFALETVASGLDSLPYSIAPLPDGSFLLTERRLGLSIVYPDGSRSEYVQNAPKVYTDTIPQVFNQVVGWGWMMDVALHPSYEENGWVYIAFGDRCEGCNELSRETNMPVTMVKLVRGRIKNEQWVDEEVIWETDLEFYGNLPDVSPGGRIAFDGKGHVFLTVGLKGSDNHTGVQDLSIPWGKVHRVYDDGRVPKDNPFYDQENAFGSIWSYGHRSPHGLEFNPWTEQLWETEMGPRGGDEINLIYPGRNYGWPLTSKGTNYEGTKVDYGKILGIDFDIEDIEQPIVDLTPSPAVSSFAFYDGDAFPDWHGDMIVGSLKARTLYRVRVEDGQLVSQEVLFENLARVRDVETGYDGNIYVLLEHSTGGKIIRIRPVSGAR
ncbi:MAG: PQQ-dependent sugar dehydrogenase [Pseudomonadota bacterium]